jgi:FkbM family methyltransferase
VTIKQHLVENKISYAPWIEDNEPGGVDLKILPYLEDIENGFFVEAGALDGLFQSNTKILEDLGWKGLLIEPSPSAAQKCRENRQQSIVENCALVSFKHEGEFVLGNFFHDGSEGGLGATSSITHDGIQVKARNLNSILIEHNIHHIDFFSLDVEGHEMEVLHGIDFKNIHITFIVIEVNSNRYSLDTLNSFMLSNGYENIINMSNFSLDKNPGWGGKHQDFLYKKINK